MPRKRMIDPEYWSDEEIGSWSFQARLFYIGLWNFADDEGRFKAASKLLKAQIFPYDDKVNMENLKKEVSNKIQWYEVENLKYGFIRNFLKYQRIDRPTLSKLPIPPQLDEQSTSNQEHIPPNISKDKIREDKVSKGSFSFETIYLKYPKKVGKKEAERHFEFSVKTDQDWKDIQTAIKNYLASERVSKGFIQNASTWFNNWKDWVEFKEDLCPKCKGKGKFVSSTGYDIICDCPKGIEKESPFHLKKPL